MLGLIHEGITEGYEKDKLIGGNSTEGAAARIVPVRARPQIGGSEGSAATIGRTVKPCPRRCGTTISSALQMVGVSHWHSVSRSSRVKGCSGMAGYMIMPATRRTKEDAYSESDVQWCRMVINIQ